MRVSLSVVVCWFVAVCSTVFATSVHAQPQLALTMRASETTVARGDVFRLEVILTVNGQDAVDELELPDLSDFTIMRENESQQASFGMRSGRRAVTVEHRRSFILRADQVGKHTIDGATAAIGNDTARARAVVITVTGKASDDDDPLPGGAAGNAANAKGATSDNTVDAGAEAAATDTVEPGARFNGSLPQIFLELRADKLAAWVGEQVTVVGEIWSRVPLGSWPRLPGQKPPGFVCLAIDDGVRPQAVQRRLRGQVFNVYPVTRDALFALSPGEKTLPPLEIDVTPAGSFFSRQDVRVTSAPLVLDIKPLPEPAPPGFVAGAVGAFDIRAAVRPQKTSVGVPATVVVEIAGHGNIDEVQVPAWSAGSARTFPPTTKRERKDNNGLIAGRVVQETLVQASTAGTLTIPAFPFVFFDTNLGQYVTKQVGPVNLVVEAGNGAASSTSPRASTRSAIAAGTRPLALDIDVREHVLTAPAPVVGGVVAVVGALVGLGARRRRTASDSVTGRRRRRQQERRVAADAAQKAGDVASAWRLLLDAVAERCGDDVRAVDTNALPALLVTRGLDDVTAAAVARAIVDAEAARFAPGGQKQQAVTQCLALVDTLDTLDAANDAGAR